MMTMNKVLSLLGLAQRAGKLACGEEQAIQAIQARKAHLVIVAKDASHNTYKRFGDKCRFYRVPIIREFDRKTLGSATGKGERVVISVTDKGFAEAMLNACNHSRPETTPEVKGIE
jgi:ribosomal protein L7Ae-like RNA K-turn-binding protein